MTRGLEDKPNYDWMRAQRERSRSLLEEAHLLATQIERLLNSPSCELSDSETFRVRLARAHTLSLLDQLSDLLGPTRAKPGLRSTATRDDDETSASPALPITSWR